MSEREIPLARFPCAELKASSHNKLSAPRRAPSQAQPSAHGLGSGGGGGSRVASAAKGSTGEGGEEEEAACCGCFGLGGGGGKVWPGLRSRGAGTGSRVRWVAVNVSAAIPVCVEQRA